MCIRDSYYAAISQIETPIIEAARLDGAGNARIMRSIIWPSAVSYTHLDVYKRQLRGRCT